MSREELIEELLASGETRTEYGWDKAIDAVLEIIDSHMPLNGNSTTNKRVRGSLKSIRKDILALKGGKQG